MAWNFGDEVQFGGGECHGVRYKIHFYCLAVEAGNYSDVVECLPVDPATWFQFPAGAGKIFSLYDIIYFQVLLIWLLLYIIFQSKSNKYRALSCKSDKAFHL